jgi:hypothetical protein
MQKHRHCAWSDAALAEQMMDVFNAGQLDKR